MAKKESNILEIKLERIVKKFHTSEFNTNLKQTSNHPVSVSQLWSLPQAVHGQNYQIIQSFGKMYVGESFTSCLKITNIILLAA